MTNRAESAASRVHIRLRVSWIATSLGLLSTGLFVALLVSLRAPGRDALDATALTLAVISFGAQLVLVAVDYLVGVRSEQRASILHQETLETVTSLRSAVESNTAATSGLSERVSSEFQTMLDYVLGELAKTARTAPEVRLIEQVGTGIREKALEVSVSRLDTARSRLASAVIRALHQDVMTVSNSVSYTQGVISWLQDPGAARCTALVSAQVLNEGELRLAVREARKAHLKIGGDDTGDCYVILPAKPPRVGYAMKDDVHVTSLESFTAELAKHGKRS